MTSVLVVYASKHGATAGIASAVAQTLNACGLRALCIEANSVRTLDGYDAVVLGSAVYMKRWRPEARHFLRRFGAELAKRPLWWTEPRRTIARAVELGARDHKVFGGVAQGAMAKNVPAEYLDRRDWDEIEGWAEGIAAQLHVPAPA
jgi:menaquinone-dependent protoporphyrinogen oxidase